MATKSLFLLLSIIAFSRTETVNNLENHEDKMASSEIRQESTLEAVAKTGLTNFTLQFQNILCHLSSSDGNVLFAPISLVEVLATLLLGAEGETKTEILQTMGLISGRNLTNKDQEINYTLGKILKYLKSECNNNSAVEIFVANGIFVQNEAHIKEQFLNQSKEIYGNEVIPTNFSESEEAINLINEWASNNTKGKIKELVQPPIISTTKLIIANTLFFNGEWEQPFLENSTWEQFYTDDGIVLAKMMVNRGTFDIYEGKNFDAVGLPYKGKDMYMYLIQPQKDHHLKEVLAGLTPKDIKEINKKSVSRDEVTLIMPYLNLTENMNIETALKQSGIKSAFDPTKATLSNIANEDLYVNDAIHKVTLQVTEAGSTGTAATTLSIETRFPQKTVYTFNKPYALFIFHKPQEVIVFWGSINIPVPHQKP